MLITGAAGSIGSALACALADFGCAHIALLDQFDHGLIEIVERVRRLNPGVGLTEALCDVRDSVRLNAWMGRIQPDVVIHSAALKHVHVGERHPAECVLTNLVGAANALAASARAGAGHFMLVSSDKAAAPTCVMGATKRLAELHLIGFDANAAPAMRLRAVRFGNVLGSQGSVLPRFTAQIETGGPLEVTHPEMERFFMSAREAVGLILSVAAIDEPQAPLGSAYYMDMGEPYSILELGRTLIERSGKTIDIRLTGLRPGEKLKEQMFDDYESAAHTPLERVFRVTPRSRNARVSAADIAQIETIARGMDDALVRQRVFAFLDERLGRAEPLAG